MQSKAICVGATGLIGRELMPLLAMRYSQSDAVTRSPFTALSSNQTNQIIDYRTPFKFSPADALFCALGTTIKEAGSPEAFRKVDFDYVLAAARAAKEAGVNKMAVVSALGANSKSSVLYSRTKGEIEEALKTLDFDHLLIVRPSFLSGDRESLGQTARPGEKITLALAQPLSFLIPKKYRAIPAKVVSRFMVERLQKMQEKVEIFESNQIAT